MAVYNLKLDLIRKWMNSFLFLFVFNFEKKGEKKKQIWFQNFDSEVYGFNGYMKCEMLKSNGYNN